MGLTMRRWVDQFLGSDPGLNRFRMALQAVVSIAAILGAENLFVRWTHALQIQVPAGVPLPPAKAAALALANHEFLVIAIMLGAMIGMMSSFGVADPTAKGQLISMLLLPWPMLAAMALGIVIGPYRIPALISFPVILAIGTYFRRFGPRGFIMGMLLFMGDFMGFFMHAALTIGDMGWIAAEIGVGVVVAMIIRFVFFYPRQAKALQRTQRSYSARARKVGALALELFDDPAHTERDTSRLQRQLTRLNEAALMIDAQLGDPGAVADGSSGQLMHQRLFDAELALTNMARFARAATKLDLPGSCRAEIRAALRGVVAGDAASARSHAETLAGLVRTDGVVGTGDDRADRATVVILRRLASSVISLCDSLTSWMDLGQTSEGSGTFEPAVALGPGGWLPGSAMVSMSASDERADRFAMPPYIRAAIQIGVAVGAAVALGDVVSGHRFYWAVIAAFITFMGANTSGEQVRKAVFRVAGTAVGIVIGSLLVHAVGHHTGWSIVVILVALFFGFYLFRVNYAFMVVGITVMVSQLYVQLDEFSNSMLLLRLGETSLGAAIGALVVLFVFPLKTRHVLRVAFSDYLQAVRQITEHANRRLLGADGAAEASLRADARAVDAAFQAVIATAQPLRRSYFGDLDEKTSGAVRMAAASRHYCRNLVADIEAAGALDTGTRLDLKRSAETLGGSLEAMEKALTGPREGTYVRSSALFEQAERRLESSDGPVGPGQLAIRDLKLVDGSMAELAKMIGLDITNYDTDMAQTQSEGGVPVRGRVVNSAGARVARAALTLIDSGGRQAAVGVSDYDGDYQLYAPAGDATYSLIVAAESHVPSATTIVVRHAAGTGVHADVRLAENGSLAGQVRSAAGGPVRGATITLVDDRGVVAGARNAGPDGSYAFGGLNDGAYTLAVSADGYRSEARPLVISGKEPSREDIQLVSVGGGVRGRSA